MLALTVFLPVWFGVFVVATHVDAGVDYWNCPGHGPTPWAAIVKTVASSAAIAASFVTGGLWLLV
jgi:hypothetical protein